MVGFVVAVIVLVGALVLTARQPSRAVGVVATVVGAVAAAAAVWTGAPLFYDGYVDQRAIAACCVAAAIVTVIVLDAFARSTYTPPSNLPN